MSDYHPPDLESQLRAENSQLQSQLTAQCLRTTRAYGAIGQLANRLADNLSVHFDNGQLADGIEFCKVTDDGRNFTVSTMGS